MDLSYLSAFLFLFLTYLYYYKIKLPLELKSADSTDFISGDDIYKSYASYIYGNNYTTAMYFLLVVTSQFGVNLCSVIQKCGGTVGKNLVVAFFMTVVPWTLIFGAVIGLLVVYPGLKGAFADVVGYFAISGEANDLLSEIIVDSKIDNKIQKTEGNGEDKLAQQEAAEAIMKLCGNKGILVNTMNPENFNSVWSILQPLLQTKFKNGANADDLFVKKKALFALIVRKDNIGEAFWYMYTGALLIAVVAYNLSARACDKDLEKMKEEQADYAAKSAEIQAKKDLQKSGNSYVMS